MNADLSCHLGPTIEGVAPHRIVVLSGPAPADLLDHGRQLLVGRASAWPHARPPRWHGWDFSVDKADLMIRIVAELARYYGRPEVFESWLMSLARREDLATTGITRHVAMLDFRFAPAIPIDVPPHDWWLFLVPDGCDWDSLDGQPVRLITAQVPDEPDLPADRLRGLERLSRILRRVELSGTNDFARLTPLQAARCFNRCAAEVLESDSRHPALAFPPTDG